VVGAACFCPVCAVCERRNANRQAQNNNETKRSKRTDKHTHTHTRWCRGVSSLFHFLVTSCTVLGVSLEAIDVNEPLPFPPLTNKRGEMIEPIPPRTPRRKLPRRSFLLSWRPRRSSSKSRLLTRESLAIGLCLYRYT
jgi:hypothetical protein